MRKLCVFFMALIFSVTSLAAPASAQDRSWDRQTLIAMSPTVMATAEQAIAEVGEITNLTEQPQTIPLANGFSQPVVIAQPPSYNGSHQSIVRITDIQSDSFSVQIQEPTYLDRVHPKAESASYLVLETGSWQLEDGTQIEVGRTEIERTVTTSGWESISFKTDFSEPPVVFTQVQTQADDRFVRLRQRNITTDGFEVAMEEEDTQRGDGHGEEILGWVAISPTDSGTWGKFPFQAGKTPQAVTDQGYTLTFAPDFAEPPHFLASMGTYRGPDATGLRYRDLTADSVQIIAEEDSFPGDEEVKHAAEVIEFLAIQGSGVFTIPQPGSGSGGPCVLPTETVATIDLDARVHNAEAPIVQPLEAGSYQVDVIGDQAWSAWSSTSGCSDDGTCRFGWLTSYGVKSEDFDLVIRPLPIRSTAEYTPVGRYQTPELALANGKTPGAFVLTNKSDVSFLIPDTQLSDNRGGLTLQISRIDECCGGEGGGSITPPQPPEPPKPKPPEECKLPGEDCTVPIGPGDDVVPVKVKIKVPESSGELPLDVMLVQDVSGSYNDDLTKLRTLVPSLVNNLRALQPDITFGLGAFADKAGGSLGAAGDYPYVTMLSPTPDAAAFERAVNGLSILNGGDTPEASLEALLQVARRGSMEVRFREGTRRVAILTTDAPYHQAGDGASGGYGIPNNGDGVINANEDYPTVAQVRQAVEQANLVPIFLVTRDVIPTYQNLVSQLGVGTVIELTTDSSNLVSAIRAGLEAVNQDLKIVILDDAFGYVTNYDPKAFTGLAPGSEVTVTVDFKYPGAGSDDRVLVRALGIGDLKIDVVVTIPAEVRAG